MRFTSVVALFCVLQTIVSALPLGPFSEEAIPREYDLELDYRSLSDPSLYRRGGPSRTPKLRAAAKAVQFTKGKPIPYQVDMHRSNIGAENEHWALHFRPQDGHQGTLHTLDAVSDKTKNGVLQPDKANKGLYTKPPAKEGAADVHIANFKSKSAAMRAMDDVHKNVKLTEQYPHKNCVDFTCQAVNRMADKGHIPQANAQAYQDYATLHQGAVRTKTNTAENRDKAGVPSS